MFLVFFSGHVQYKARLLQTQFGRTIEIVGFFLFQLYLIFLCPKKTGTFWRETQRVGICAVFWNPFICNCLTLRLFTSRRQRICWAVAGAGFLSAIGCKRFEPQSLSIKVKSRSSAKKFGECSDLTATSMIL